MTFGTYEPISAEKNVLIYARRSDRHSVAVVMNIGSEPISVRADIIGREAEIRLSTFLDRSGEKVSRSFDLRGNEGVILKLQA